MAYTITEGLAEIKTIGKRLEKRRAFILQHLARSEQLKDPLEKDGGATSVINSERQGIRDLEARIILIRRAILKANMETTITVGGVERSIADWITWKREVAEKHKGFLDQLTRQLAVVREQAKRQGSAIVSVATEKVEARDIVINIDEKALADEIEAMENILGTLDGQLSLKNATTIIDV